jgi:NAD(P)-dependent dehydrogenase (short-subunit alcohol dehydrogenase family)
MPTHQPECSDLLIFRFFPAVHLSFMAKVTSQVVFNEATTAEEVAANFGTSIRDKYIIVTGGAGGLGLETSRVLCKYGGKVTITCRTEKQGLDVVKMITTEQGDSAVISYELMDLQDLDSVKNCAQSILASGKPINILVNNAGVMACEHARTKQGFEMQFGVNHIGHFAFTKLLLPQISASGTADDKSRIINLSSMGNWLYGPPTAILWDDLSGDLSYNKWERYGQSKLANILFTTGLEQIAGDQNLNIISSAVHPGVIMETNLARHGSMFSMVTENLAFNFCRPSQLYAIMLPFHKNTQQGAATTVFCVMTPVLIPGGYYVDCNETTHQLHPLAKDTEVARRLWEVSEALVKPYL